MINKRMVSDADKLTEQAVKAMPNVIGGLLNKMRAASPEEKKQIEEIKAGIKDNLKSGGKEGALKYLGHIKTQL